MPAASRFGLIGCGAIGSLLDEGLAGPSRTHASAVVASSRAELVAVADVDEARARACASARGVARWYADPIQMLRHERLDAVAVATPPVGRAGIVAAAIEAGVRLVWLEKPAAASLEEAEDLRARCAQAGIAVAVNHLRRWAPLADELRRLASPESIGHVQHVVGWYGKGIVNNGSHVLDLVAATIGTPSRGAVLRVVDDGRDTDPTVDALVDVDVAGRVIPLHLVGTDHRAFSLLEVQVTGTRGRVHVVDGGRQLVREDVADDPDFPGYARLREVERRRDLLAGMFDRAVSQLCDVLEGLDATPMCTLEDSMVSLAVADDLRRVASAR